VPPGSPESWRIIGDLVQTLHWHMPSLARISSIPDPSVQFTASRLYQAAEGFINADFGNPYAAQAAASQLHFAAQQHSQAIANAIHGVPSGPGGPGLPPGTGRPPGGGPPPGTGLPPGIPPGRRISSRPGGVEAAGAEDTGEVELRFWGPCPPFPFWAWCLCTCDKHWESCVASTPPFWWWWCDLVFWWCTFWC
jgi:hypothetical protein